jgi:hypothetical protein
VSPHSINDDKCAHLRVDESGPWLFLISRSEYGQHPPVSKPPTN